MLKKIKFSPAHQVILSFIVTFCASCQPCNKHFKKLIFGKQQQNKTPIFERQQPNTQENRTKENSNCVQQEIEEHRDKIKLFLRGISNQTELMMKPLPISSRKETDNPRIYSCVIDLAMHRRNIDLLGLIVAKPFLEEKFWGSIIYELARLGKSKVIIELLNLCRIHQKYDISKLIEYRNDTGLTPLIVAAGAGHRECVRVLLENGANPVIQIHNRIHNCTETITALHAVVENRHGRGRTKTVKIVDLLCKANANPEVKGRGIWEHEPVSAIDHARAYDHNDAAKTMEAYCLHKAKDSYFSLLPPDLLIQILQ